MTTTTRVRFLEPTDPREVFDLVVAIAGQPTDEVYHGAPDEIYLNPYIRTDAPMALVCVEYGAEGSLLLGDEPTDPAAYVEARVTSSSSAVEMSWHRAFSSMVLRTADVRTCWLTDTEGTAWRTTSPYSAR